MIGHTWYPTALMRALKHFLAYDYIHKSIVHQLDFIAAFLQANVKHRFLLKWTVDMKNTYQNIATILEDH